MTETTDTTTIDDAAGPPAAPPTPEQATWRFVRALERLAGADGREPDRAALAALRSGLGKPPGSAVAMYPYLGEHLRGGDEWGSRPAFADEAWNTNLFIVASLFGLHPTIRAATGDDGGDDTAAETTISPDSSRRSRSRYGRPFLAALQSIRTGDRERDQAIDRRIVALLNADPDALPTLLRQAVGLLDDDVPVDWLQLLRDLNQWDHPDRFVQKRWASIWWTAPTRAEIASAPDDASETSPGTGTD